MLEFLKIMKDIFDISVNENEIYDMFIKQNVKVYHVIIKDLDNGQIIRKQISRKQYEKLSKLLAQNNIVK